MDFLKTSVSIIRIWIKKIKISLIIITIGINNCHEFSFEIKRLAVVPTVACESKSSISKNLRLDDFSMNNKNKSLDMNLYIFNKVS